MKEKLNKPTFLSEDDNGVKLTRMSLGHQYYIESGNKNTLIDFQNGPVKENGVNGLTNEVLLEILIDRTEYLDNLFPCKENKNAIKSMKKALSEFNKRTKDRKDRGVEGTNKK